MNKLILSIIATVLLATGLVVYENAILRCRFQGGSCHEEMRGCETKNAGCGEMNPEKCGSHKAMCGDVKMKGGHGECGMMGDSTDTNHMGTSEGMEGMPECCKMKMPECCMAMGKGHESGKMMMHGKCSEKDMEACKEMMMKGKCSEKDMKACKEMMMHGKGPENEMKMHGKCGMEKHEGHPEPVKP
jgi:hypothetical protein